MLLVHKAPKHYKHFRCYRTPFLDFRHHPILSLDGALELEISTQCQTCPSEMTELFDKRKQQHVS